MSIRQICLPRSFVTIAVKANIYSKTTSLSIDEVAIIDSAVTFHIFALPLTHIILEETVLNVSIIVSKLSKAIRNVILDASYIIGIHEANYLT